MSFHPETTSAVLPRFSPKSSDFGFGPNAGCTVIQVSTRPNDLDLQQKGGYFFLVTAETTHPVAGLPGFVRPVEVDSTRQDDEAVPVSDSYDYLGISERKFLVRGDKRGRLKALRGMESTPELSSYLMNIYALERKGQDRAASKVIFRFIETQFSADNFSAVNALLEAIDLAGLGPWSISGLVRFTSRARSHLPHWLTTFNQAKTVLTENGYSPEDLLIGIRG